MVLCGENSQEAAEATFKQYNELHSKFRLMSASLEHQYNSIKTRTRHLEDALEAVIVTENKALSEKPNYRSLFKAADCVFTEATVTDPNHVLLWLGVNRDNSRTVF